MNDKKKSGFENKAFFKTKNFGVPVRLGLAYGRRSFLKQHTVLHQEKEKKEHSYSTNDVLY